MKSSVARKDKDRYHRGRSYFFRSRDKTRKSRIPVNAYKQIFTRWLRWGFSFHNSYSTAKVTRLNGRYRPPANNDWDLPKKPVNPSVDSISGIPLIPFFVNSFLFRTSPSSIAYSFRMVLPYKTNVNNMSMIAACLLPLNSCDFGLVFAFGASLCFDCCLAITEFFVNDWWIAPYWS